MKITIKTILAVVAAGIFSVAAYSQTKIGVVDMANLHDNHYKFQEQKALLEADLRKAGEEEQKMVAQIQGLYAQLQELEEKNKNPALNETGRLELENEFNLKAQDAQLKQQELNQYQQNIRRSLQERQLTMREGLIKEISVIVKTVANEKGITLVLDKSGRSMSLIPTIVYSEGVEDITVEVANRINAGRPAGAATGTGPAPAVSFPAN